MLLKKPKIYLFTVVFVLITGAYLLVPHSFAQQSASDVKLLALAIQKGLVPSLLDKTFLEKHKADNVLLWITFSHENKAVVIDNLKKAFSKSNLKAEESTDFYIEKMNDLITDMIMKEKITKTENTQKLLPIFKIVALERQ